MTRRRVQAAAAIAAVFFIGFIGVRLVRHPVHTAQHKEKPAYYCPMHPTYTSDRPGDCPICNMRLVKQEKQEEKKVLYWTDPMIPGYKSDKPGKSPMGMDLVPVYEEGGAEGETPPAGPAGYASIRMTPQKQQFIGVKTAPVQKRAIAKTIRTVGRIAYDPELYQAQQEYLQAVRAMEKAQGSRTAEGIGGPKELVESSRMRLRLLGLSQELIDEIAAWEGPDQSLLLADPGKQVWLYAPIYEFELPLVKIGQTIRVEVPAVPGKALEGAVRAVDPVLDPATRSARVRAVLTDPEGFLKPEMFVNAAIVVSLGEVLSVPDEAVFDTGSRQILFVAKGEGLFEPREVTVGVKADGYYEIKAGVTEGEGVVTSGNFLIDSESRLKSALQGMDGGGGHKHGQ